MKTINEEILSLAKEKDKKTPESLTEAVLAKLHLRILCLQRYSGTGMKYDQGQYVKFGDVIDYFGR